MHIEHWQHPACLDDEQLRKQCTMDKGRGSGPGGQHRNKVETLVELRHDSTGIEVHAGERRSAQENFRVAMRRLRLALAIGVRTGVPIGEIGSALWRSRVRGGKISCNPEHADYPSLLAEALDVLASANWDTRKAALRLGCTATQLVRLVQEHPPAMLMVNRERAARKMRPLK
jgi:hypothetical protein